MHASVISGGNPFSNMEKSSVLQEARTFNETPINPRKCGYILTKVLYLINQVGALHLRFCPSTATGVKLFHRLSGGGPLSSNNIPRANDLSSPIFQLE